MIINVEEELKVKEIHLAWYTKPSLIKTNSVDLIEIVRVMYKHPTVPEYATISQIEEKIIKTVSRTQRSKVGHLELLENAQNVVSAIEEIT